MRSRGLQVLSVLSIVAGVVAVPLALFLVWNPLNLAHDLVLFPPVVVVAAASVITAAALGRQRFGRVPLIVAIVVSVCALLWTGLGLVVNFIFGADGHEVQQLARADGKYRIVVVEGASFVAVDPIYEVRIRSGGGLLSRETVVWKGYEEGPRPTTRFDGPRTIEITTDDGCRYVSTFDGLTLQPDRTYWQEPGRRC